MNFVAPIAFAFLATVPVVVLFYLLKRKRTVRLVPSTLLWQKFLAESQASAPFQRLRHNWLLLFQILLLLLAVLALSRPFFQAQITGGSLQVVILDASASMQSIDESPSRFEKAREAASRLVDALRDTDQMVILQAGANTAVRQSATSDKGALRRALQASAVTDSPTRLSEALKMAESLTKDNNDAEIHLFTDGAATGMKELENKGLRLVYHRIGKSGDNLGIVSLDVRPNPENPGQRAVFAGIANFRAEEQTVQIELEFEGRLIEAKSVTVPATNTLPVVFIAGQEQDGVFSVRLNVSDNLTADNEAFILSRLPQPVRVHLVSRGNRFLEKALRAAGRVELTSVPDLTEARPEADLVVLDNVTPSVWPERSVLAIRALATNWFDAVAEIEGPPIVDWKPTHPLLRFVGFDNVQVAKALAVKTPTWALGVVESPQGPLILAGELARQRIVWIAFDALESTWPLRISFPIFIANAVDWLNPASVQTKQSLIPAGDPFRFPLPEPVDKALITMPGGDSHAVPIDPGAAEFVFGDTSRRGVYRVALGTNQTVFCANVLDTAESDIRPRDELDFGRFGSVQATTTRRASLEIWRWIAAVALGVLLFEWWFYHRRTA